MKIFLGEAVSRRNKLVKESARGIDPKLLAAYEEALDILKTQDPSIDEDYLLYHLNGERAHMSGEAIWVETPLGDINDEQQEEVFNYLTREKLSRRLSLLSTISKLCPHRQGTLLH